MAEVNLPKHGISLRVREYGTKRRITAHKISNRVADAVAPRFRQVFAWPQRWTVEPECSLAACKGRRYADCATWAHSPLSVARLFRAVGGTDETHDILLGPYIDFGDF